MVMKILRFWKFSSRTNFGRIKTRFFLEISRIKFFYFRFHKNYSVLWAKFYFSPFLHAPVAVVCHCWRSLKNHGVGVEIWSQLIWRIFCFIIIIGQVRGSPTDQSDLVKIFKFFLFESGSVRGLVRESRDKVILAKNIHGNFQSLNNTKTRILFLIIMALQLFMLFGLLATRKIFKSFFITEYRVFLTWFWFIPSIS